MRYFRHTLQHNKINNGVDQVIGHALIPSDGSMNGVQGEVICQADNVPVTKVVLYACDGWLIPVEDPDTIDTIDDIWDRFVSKDSSIGNLDTDTSTPNIAQFDEPGEVNVDAVIGMEAMAPTNRFFRRRHILAFQKGARGFIDGTPDSYYPGDAFKVKVGRKMAADQMSVAVLGFSHPVMNITTTVFASSPSEKQWMQLKYLEVVLEQAWMDMVGLTEAGAETPWEEASLFIEDMLEPTVQEATSGAFENPGFMDVWTQLSWDLSVPGRRDLSSALTGAS